MQPTEKMINFAKIIAEMLQINTPDLTSYYATHKFINDNSKEYWEIATTKEDDIIDFQLTKIKEIYEKENINFTDNFIQELEKVNKKQGIYILWSKNQLVYIGKSKNLKTRSISSIYERNRQMIITAVSYINTISEADMHILEPLLISEYKPILNNEFNCSDYSNHFKSNINITDLFKNRIPIIENEIEYIKNEEF